MRVLFMGSVFGAVLTLSLAASAQSVSLPLPERNPIRDPGLPLPERNPLRDADEFSLPLRDPSREPAFLLPDRNPQREAAFALPERNPQREASLALPERNPLRIEEGAEEESEKPEPDKWTDEEIAAARAHCAKVLEGVALVTEPDDPVREGACGAPGPVRLISIGRDPEVRLSPPSTVTCDMAAAMARWMERDVQPAARKLLGGPVTRINIIGHYSCRNALGRITTRLSEHGLANALDIRDFVIGRDQVADLKRDWGPTARDIAARIAAEKAAEAARKVAAAAAAEAAKKAAAEGKEEVAALDAKKDAKRMALGSEGAADAKPGGKGSGDAAAGGPSLSPAEKRRAEREARRLAKVQEAAPPPARKGERATGGPDPTKPPDHMEESSPRQEFLREIHAKACATFGTVLGPEANDAHRDHFHLDMAKRRYRSYCE